MISTIPSRAIGFGSILLASLLLTTSCENKTTQTASDSTQQAEKENDAKFDNKKQENDAKFLVEATGFYLEQEKLAPLGDKRGGPAVKALVAQMKADHEKAYKAATDAAKAKHISVPDTASSESSEAYHSLDGKAGKDFDKAYCDRLVETHKKAVEAFEKEAADSRDPDLKDWAKTELPNLRKQLDFIFDCQKKAKL